MKRDFKIIETTDSLKIKLIIAQKAIIKIGLFIQGIIYLGGCLLFVFLIKMTIINIPPIYGFFSFPTFFLLIMETIFLIIVILASRTYFASIFMSEHIIVDCHKLSYKKTVLFFTKTIVFPIDKPISIKHIGRQKFTKHPLDSGTIDYTGLGTAERELQYLIKDGTMELTGGKTKLIFGREISTWDAEVIISKIHKFIHKETK